jgi:hypothetical protein
MQEIQQMATNGVRLIVRLDRYRRPWAGYRQYKALFVHWLNRRQKWHQFILSEETFEGNLSWLELQLGPQAVPQLVNLLVEDEGGAAVQRLMVIGGPAVPLINDLLTNANAKIRLGALDVLGSLLDRDRADHVLVEQGLVRCLHDSDPTMRYIAAANLVRRRPTRDLALPVLTVFLKGPDERLRFQAALTLAEVPSGCDLAVPVLAQALTNSDATVRRMARYALSNAVPATKAGMGLGAWLSKQYE